MSAEVRSEKCDFVLKVRSEKCDFTLKVRSEKCFFILPMQYSAFLIISYTDTNL